MATITGDSLMLRPNDYGARISFVDYDGSNALEVYKCNPPKTESDEALFVQEVAPSMDRGVQALKRWVEGMQG
jgi:aspartate aminotransferase